MIRVVEGSAFALRVEFTDADGNPAAPIAVEYRIYDETSGVDVRATSPYTGPLAATIDIPIVESDTRAIAEPECNAERRMVIVSAIFGPADKWVSEHVFAIVRQPGTALQPAPAVIDGGVPSSTYIDDVDGGTP